MDVLLTAAATASLLAARAGRSERSDCAPLASSVGVRRLSLGESSPWGADSSDASDDSSDSEVPRADYWECVRCKRKCTPLFRFCLKCFQESLGSASSQEVLGSTCTQDSAVGTSQEALTCEPSSDSSAMQCFMCLERPRDGGFCHRQNVHVLTCYRCALKVWNQTRRCPLCNKPPNNISRLIFG